MHLLSSETFIDLLEALWFHTKWRQKRCQVVIGLPFVLGSKDCQIGKKGVSGSWCHSLCHEPEGNNITAGIISASLSWQDWHGARYTLQGWGQKPNSSHVRDTLSALSSPGDKQSFQGMGTAEENSLLIYILQHSSHAVLWEQHGYGRCWLQLRGHDWVL